MNLDLNISHYREFKASAIADDIIDLNFRSGNPESESDLDDTFSLLAPDATHLNNGTLPRGSNQNLANTLRGGWWVFEGLVGVSVKPDSPRTDKDGKTIKYESVRGDAQLFVPRVSVRSAGVIAANFGIVRDLPSTLLPESEDEGFWGWFIASELPMQITEGCKKASAIVSAGYPAIALNGVYGWGSNDRDIYGNLEKDASDSAVKTLHPELAQFIRDREVVLAFDLDTKEKTINYVNKAKSLFADAVSDIVDKVTEIKWKDAKYKGVDDWLSANPGKAFDRLFAKRAQVKLLAPKKSESAENNEKPPTAAELGMMAGSDVYANGNAIRYEVELQQYWEYRSGMWVKISNDEIFVKIQDYAGGILGKDLTVRMVTDTMRLALKHALVAEWITTPSTKLIPFKNGVLDVIAKQLLPHSASYGFKWQMPRDYSPVAAIGENIGRFLHEFCCGNLELKNLLLAYCHATLTGRSDLHKFLFLSGSGGNGKGAFMNLLEALVGSQNTSTTSLASLCENRFEPAGIKDKLLVICADEDKAPDTLTVFKSATGGDSIKCEHKGKQSFDFKFGGMFVVAANKPIFRGENTLAMQRRKIDFPCLHRPSEDVRRDLMAEFEIDLPGFTTYILNLDREWVNLTLKSSSRIAAVRALALQQAILENSVAGFYDDRLIADDNSEIESSELYKKYQDFCIESGHKPSAMSTFVVNLMSLCNETKGLNVTKSRSNSKRYIKGIRVMTALDKVTDLRSDSDGLVTDPSPYSHMACDGVTGFSLTFTRKESNKEENKNIDLDLDTHAVIEKSPSPLTPKSRKPLIDKGLDAVTGQPRSNASPSRPKIGDKFTLGDDEITVTTIEGDYVGGMTNDGSFIGGALNLD